MVLHAERLPNAKTFAKVALEGEEVDIIRMNLRDEVVND